MSQRDYYEVLEVSRGASPDQIKTAYRRLAKKYHPDRNRGDKTAESRFKEVQEAYEVLSDPAKRRVYDQHGHAGVHGNGPAGPQAGGWRSAGRGPSRAHTWSSGGEVPIENLEDLFTVFGGMGDQGGSSFEEIFGRGRRGRGGRRTRGPAAPTQPGEDIEHEMPISFDESVHGGERQLQFTSPDGHVQTMTVRIPKGVRDGQRIRVRGKGQMSATGGPAGDLFIVCRIQPHPVFRRLGDDVYINLPLTVSEATLGTRVEIPTLDGRTVLKVPPGTPSGARLRLKDRGVQPPGDKPRGHQYAVVQIVPPKNLTAAQTRLLEEFRALGEGAPRADLPW
jgi:DnaJ-class molecular chaperone